MVELIDLSAGGVRVRPLIEPELDGKAVSFEIALPGRSGTVWARGERIRRTAGEETYRFVGLDSLDEAYLNQLAQWTG